jgi:drug/metabolite transporter (DMT)-like permease
LSRGFRMNKQFSPITMTSIYFYFCSAICFCLVIFSRQSFFPPQLASLPYIVVLLYSAIFITLITYFLFQWTIEHLSATTASFKQYIETVFAVLLNTLFLGETMTSGFLVGAVLVLMGLIVATVGRLKFSIKQRG